MDQDESLGAGGDLLTTTKIPSKISTNLEEVEKYGVGSELTREDMDKLWLTQNLLGWYEKDILVWHHRLNYFSFKSLLRLSKRGMIPRNPSKVINPPLVLPVCLEIPKIGHGGPKMNVQTRQSGDPYITDTGT